MLAALARPFRHAAPPEAFDFMQEAGGTAGELVCLDCAATSLDLRSARLLSLAAVRIRGNRVLTSSALQLDIAGPEHDDGQGMSALEAVQKLLRFIGPRPVVGYWLDFDLELLEPQIERLLGCPLPNATVEVSALYHARIRRQPRAPHRPLDLRFETLRRDLELPALESGSPLAHAVLTALMYLKLSAAPDSQP